MTSKVWQGIVLSYMAKAKIASTEERIKILLDVATDPISKPSSVKEATTILRKMLCGELVYVLKAGGLSSYKIGRALDVEKRVSELDVGCPVPLKLVCAFQGGEQEEKKMHKRYARNRIKGEWFNLDLPTIEDIKEYAQSRGWYWL